MFFSLEGKGKRFRKKRDRKKTLLLSEYVQDAVLNLTHRGLTPKDKRKKRDKMKENRKVRKQEEKINYDLTSQIIKN